MTRFLALLLLTVPLATGCASTRYEPARSPRIAFVSNAVVKDGKKYPNYFGGGVVEAVRGNPRAEAEARKGRWTPSISTTTASMPAARAQAAYLAESGFVRSRRPAPAFRAAPSG